MSPRGIRGGVVSTFAAAFFSTVTVSAGSANAQTTAAAAATGGLAVIGLGAQALTGSRLDITVEMYAPTEDQRQAMRLGHRPAIMQALDDRRSRDGSMDPAGTVSPQEIVGISLSLRRVMPALAEQSAALQKAVASLTAFNVGVQSANVQNVITAMEAQRKSVDAALSAWNDFETTLRNSLPMLDQVDVRDTLVGQLLTMRINLSRAARRDAVNTDYINFLKARLALALYEDAKAAKVPKPEAVRAQVDAMLDVKDDPAAGAARRIAAVLDATRQSFALVPANASGAHPNVDEVFKWFALSIDSTKLARLSSMEEIVATLAPPLSPSMGSAARSSNPSELSLACRGDAVLIVVRTCSEAGYTSITLTLNRLTADVNLGPISNEVAQVLQAANRSLSIISDPANAERWRPAAYAKTHTGPGNQNAIVYFENMGLPIVKSSTFDPTKFIVAQGLLYRQVFSAAVAAFGAPLPSTAGSAGSSDFQNSNVISAKAKIRNAEKATAAVRQKILDALKAAIAQQQGVKDASPAWATKGPAALTAAQKALQDAATQLESIAGAK